MMLYYLYMLNEKQIWLKAQEVQVGDKIYDEGYFMPDKWVRVRGIEILEGNIVFDVGHCQMGYQHPLSAIVVMRRT